MVNQLLSSSSIMSRQALAMRSATLTSSTQCFFAYCGTYLAFSFCLFFFFFSPDILQSGSRYWTRRGALTVHEEWRLFTWDNGSRHPWLASSYCFIQQKVSLKLTQNLGRFFFCWNLGWLHCSQGRRAGLWFYLSVFCPSVPHWNWVVLCGCKRRRVCVLVSRLCCCCRTHMDRGYKLFFVT